MLTPATAANCSVVFLCKKAQLTQKCEAEICPLLAGVSFQNGETMQIEEKIVVKATPEQIFNLYENVSEWSSWDPDVQYSTIDGEFKVGAKGKLKPTKGPEAKIEFTEVTKNKSFTTISKLPLCTISFFHKLAPSSEGTKVTHTVVFSGLLSSLFARLIGSGIKTGLPETMQGLRNAFEAKAKNTVRLCK